MGITPVLSQEEGGKQGDPLMPLLFAWGQHRALEAIHENMWPGEHVMAFLDDIYTACRPERLDEVHTTVDEQLVTHAHIHVHQPFWLKLLTRRRSSCVGCFAFIFFLL